MYDMTAEEILEVLYRMYCRDYYRGEREAEAMEAVEIAFQKLQAIEKILDGDD